MQLLCNEKYQPIANMRKQIILLSLVMGTLAAVAQQPEQCLIVQTKSDGLKTFPLSEVWQINFERDKIKIVGRYFVFPLEEIVLLYYLYTTDGVANVAGNGWTIEEKDGQMMVHGLKDGTPVMLYTAAGVLVSSHKIESGQPLTLSARSLSSGIYIIQANHQTFKFQKK